MRAYRVVITYYTATSPSSSTFTTIRVASSENTAAAAACAAFGALSNYRYVTNQQTGETVPYLQISAVSVTAVS